MFHRRSIGFTKSTLLASPRDEVLHCLRTILVTCTGRKTTANHPHATQCLRHHTTPQQQRTTMTASAEFQKRKPSGPQITWIASTLTFNSKNQDVTITGTWPLSRLFCAVTLFCFSILSQRRVPSWNRTYFNERWWLYYCIRSSWWLLNGTLPAPRTGNRSRGNGEWRRLLSLV